MGGLHGRQAKWLACCVAHFKSSPGFVVFRIDVLPKPGELAAVQLKLANQLLLAGCVYSDLFPRPSSTCSVSHSISGSAYKAFAAS